jgi:two-component system NtrC family response regulator
MDLLCNYHYPGNVRELRNIIQRSVLVCNKNVLEPEDIVIGEQRAETKANSGPLGDSLNLEDWENHLIKKAMLASNNVQAKAAIMLGISPFALNRRLRKE